MHAFHFLEIRRFVQDIVIRKCTNFENDEKGMFAIFTKAAVTQSREYPVGYCCPEMVNSQFGLTGSIVPKPHHLNL